MSELRPHDFPDFSELGQVSGEDAPPLRKWAPNRSSARPRALLH